MATNVPGKDDRQSMSLVDVMRRFPNEKAAHAWFAERRWGGTPTCPRCGTNNVQIGTAHKTMPYRCRPCRRFFSVRIGTVMEDSKLSCQVWAIAICLLTTSLKGQPSMKLHRGLGVTRKTAWHLAHRIRECWSTSPKVGPFFGGPVEIDETCVGGKRHKLSNQHRKQVESMGPGPGGKTAVAGAADRESGQRWVEVIGQKVDKKTPLSFIRSTTGERAMACTDESVVYLGRREKRHRAVSHSAWEYVRGIADPNNIESFWSMPERGYIGTYRRTSEKHLGRYVDEFAGQHHGRDLDTSDQMQRIAARGLLGKRLTYAEFAG